MNDFGMQDVYTLQIKRHRRVNDIVSPNCEACQKGFLHVNSLQVREFTQTGKLPGVCKSCNTSFLKICRIQIRNMTQNDAHSHVCDICGKAFTHAGNYMKHKRLHSAGEANHQHNAEAAAGIITVNNNVASNRPSPPHTCGKCGKQFMKYGSYLNHLEGHDIRENLVCPICERTCSTRATFKVHVERCKNRQAVYVCQYCENTFGTKSSLKTHLETHVVATETNICKFCKESFHVAEELEQHLLQHLSEHSKELKEEEGHPCQAEEKFNHFCVECNKAFVHLGTLRNHMQTHSGNLPYQCKTCKKQFVHSGRLKKHMKQHRRKWPYTCLVCMKRFINLKSFRKHKVTHKE